MSMEENWLFEENPLKHTSQLPISKTNWSILYYTNKKMSLINVLMES